jgi:hypothetical protein
LFFSVAAGGRLRNSHLIATRLRPRTQALPAASSL